MTNENDDLRRNLESLADRGEPRGAEAVLAAARRQVAAAEATQRPLYVAAALAAAVLAVLGTTAVVVHEDDGDQQLAGSAATATTVDWDSGVGEAVLPPTTELPATADVEAPRRPRLTRAQRSARLQRYPSCDSLVDATRRKALEVVGPYGLPGSAGPILRSVTAPAQAEGASTTNAGGAALGEGDAVGGPDDASATNVQEEGVDEPDRVETDGRRLFTLRDNRLWYATIENERLRYENSITLDQPNDMVLVGDRMVVFGNRFDTATGTSKAVVSVVDVRTPQMGVASSLVFDGHHVSARVVDGVVRAVVHSGPTGLDFAYPADNSDGARAAAANENREAVAKAPRDAWLPSLVVEDGLRRTRATHSLVDCNAAYHPQRFSGFGLITVLTFDPADPDAVRSTAIQADGDRVYASKNTLYVATSGWQDIAVAGDVVNRVVPDPVTHVHAFDISDPKAAKYTVSGSAPGTTIGQFAFSEHEGHLRVASTTQQLGTTATSSESWVTVLRDNGAALEQVGQVGGLGRGERIYAVRFMGPLGYVVTFRQIDPLYVVDLADPKAPKVVGELKVPGVSTYLHPIGPGLLLGVGQDADEQGRIRGAQFSVFDVTVPAQPTRLHHVAIELAAVVGSDHHAFLWWAKTGLALVPVWETKDGRSQPSVIGLQAGKSTLRDLGRITHPEGGEGYPTHIERSVVIGSKVFTVSRQGILASDLATLAPGDWTPYPAS